LPWSRGGGCAPLLLGVGARAPGGHPRGGARPASWSAALLENVLFDVVTEWIDGLVPADATALFWEVTTPDGTQDHRPVGPSR
ncbi:DUF6389 family protein, partial [Streptomyces bacillaris]